MKNQMVRDPDIPAAVDQALKEAARAVGLLAAVTPVNGAAERIRLQAAFAAGRPEFPRWAYAPTPTSRAAEALAIAHGFWAARAPEDPLGPLHLARCEELARELALIERRGTSAFGELSAARFPSHPRAGLLAAELAASPIGADEEPACTSDGDEPDSLVQCLRATVGALRVPFRVEVRSDLVPLAATGDRVILVAAGRKLTRETVRRTVIHEVEGHVLPRVRAAAQPLRLFAIGTAQGIDEQEGYALVLEERGGFLAGGRAHELAARHDAVTAMRAGADFVECVRRLRERGVSIDLALRIVERAYRGGDGRGAGLGRESVYLSSLVRVREHLAQFPDDERVLSSGQVSVAAAPALRDWLV